METLSSEGLQTVAYPVSGRKFTGAQLSVYIYACFRGTAAELSGCGEAMCPRQVGRVLLGVTPALKNQWVI